MKLLNRITRNRDMTTPVSAWPMTYYRRWFGFIILLELLYMTDTIMHVIYEKWEPCYVPIFRDLDIPITHNLVDGAIFVGMFLSLLFVFDKIFTNAVLQTFLNVGLFLTYTYLRIIHFYNWNNHYYLNMLVLGLFCFIPGGSRLRRPLWEYQLIQFFYGTVYFFAGVSKISSAWVEGVVAESMIDNHHLLIPNLMLSWGGLLLDLLGGLVIMANCVWNVDLRLSAVTHVMFTGFHGHNLAFLFKSIQFFPLHMLLTPLIFLTLDPLQVTDKSQSDESSSITDSDDTPTVSSPSKRLRIPRRSMIPWIAVVAQALLATRRFFLIVDQPWEIIKANDIAEFHSQVHHFSWRMKSRTCASGVHAGGLYPSLLTIGISKPSSPPEDVGYLHYMKVFFNKITADPEQGIQPLINKVRRMMPDASPEDVQVNLFWWSEINHQPYQLIVNPELNFVGATHLPLFSAPPKSHIEYQVIPRDDWRRLVGQTLNSPALSGLHGIPLVSRAIPEKWIPNPVISIERPAAMPKVIGCIYGDIVLRHKGLEFLCPEGGFVELPEDGQFHLKFNSESMIVLAFNK